jgi:hypothetical protein
MPTSADMTMVRGDTRIVRATFVDEAGAVLSLVGCTIRWWMAKTASGPSLLSKAIGSGITVVNAASGRFDVRMAPADTANVSTIPPGDYYHECEVVDNAGEVATVFAGKLTITKDLVR